MTGATVAKLQPKTDAFQRIMLTPAMATALLESNRINRPVQDGHVKRIAAQIRAGKWKFNGDTIKISESGDVLDGQHRCWAVIEANTPVETMIVRGIHADAFSTIDTIRKMRSGADVIALSGITRHRNVVASSLAWLLRWQRGAVPNYRVPGARIENSDIEAALVAHPNIVQAVERASKLRRLVNPSLIAWVYYLVQNRNEGLAERMMTTLEDPSSIAINDPFFRLRAYFTADHYKHKEPDVTIALIIKALNAAAAGKKIEKLYWKKQGKIVEAFPKLEIRGGQDKMS